MSKNQIAADYEKEVIDLCLLAQEPERAHAFIEASTPREEVVRALLESTGWSRAIEATNAKVGQW